MGVHYSWIDKDNYLNKISETQIKREKHDYLTAIILHMWAQLVLQLLFPMMFFSSKSYLYASSINTFLTHVLVVEPLYYFMHRWLHNPKQMKEMHGFHHLSINPVPSTSLVQNFKEHFIYIATFGPAMIFPFFIFGYQNWEIIMAYLVLFDLINAYGHTNIKCRHWVFRSNYSPLKYLFYTPEFHLGHHALFNYNYGLFMPIWDHLFDTYRDYSKNDTASLLPEKKQDFVFIGHNGGLGHFLTIPEYNIYNVYDKYVQFLPIKMDLYLMHLINQLLRMFTLTYKVPRYLINKEYIGRVITLVLTPIDYLQRKNHDRINKEMLDLIRFENKYSGTRCFGLGNLNKMKQLNDGGNLVVEMIKNDKELCDKNIRIWTGDTLTTASVYKQMMAIPNLNKIFFIGANGKIGSALVKLFLAQGIKVCIFSKFKKLEHENLTYTEDLHTINQYKFILIGKSLDRAVYKKALDHNTTKRYMFDYTVPFMRIRAPHVAHVQIGVLSVTNDQFLKGYYDICFGLHQHQIYPCHAGCILNLVMGRKTDEVGEINIDEIEPMWKTAESFGLKNRELMII